MGVPPKPPKRCFILLGWRLSTSYRGVALERGLSKNSPMGGVPPPKRKTKKVLDKVLTEMYNIPRKRGEVKYYKRLSWVRTMHSFIYGFVGARLALDAEKVGPIAWAYVGVMAICFVLHIIYGYVPYFVNKDNWR